MVLLKTQRMKDLLLRARVVLRTSRMKNSHRRLVDYVKKMHEKACRTCSTIVFPYSTNQIVDLWCCRCLCRRHFLHFLVSGTGQHQGLRMRKVPSGLMPCNTKEMLARFQEFSEHIRVYWRYRRRLMTK